MKWNEMDGTVTAWWRCGGGAVRCGATLGVGEGGEGIMCVIGDEMCDGRSVGGARVGVGIGMGAGMGAGVGKGVGKGVGMGTVTGLMK